MGDMLAFVERAKALAWSSGTPRRTRGMVRWDCQRDTLVGGVGHAATGTRGGLWLPVSEGLLFVSANDLLRPPRAWDA